MPEEPTKSLRFEFDIDSRIAMIMMQQEREHFAIAPPPPIMIGVPFALLKEAVAQILSVEVDMALMKLPGGVNTPRKRWPKGLQGVKLVAERLADAAELEKAGQAMVDEHQPAFRPNLVLGSDGQ